MRELQQRIDSLCEFYSGNPYGFSEFGVAHNLVEYQGNMAIALMCGTWIRELLYVNSRMVREAELDGGDALVAEVESMVCRALGRWRRFWAYEVAQALFVRRERAPVAPSRPVMAFGRGRS